VPISILSYNVHWGLSTFRRMDVTESLSTFIHSARPDVILLQELWLPKGNLEYLLAKTLKEVWPHQICVATCLLPQGNQGNGILSRHEIIEWRHIDLSHSKHQSRSFVHARIGVDEGRRALSLICTHFGLKRSERQHQAVVLADYIEQEIDREEAVVLGGDFNDWRGEVTGYFRQRVGLKEVFKEAYGRHARSYPAMRPFLALDRLYIRGLGFDRPRVLKDAGWRGSSDHLPLAVDLTF
jgi:endonuclease/exonuclease/phosphatase family metal-dependent hydrolase